MLSPLPLLLLLASSAIAAPPQLPFAVQNHIDPLKHLSAISPFFIPTKQPTPLPPQCKLRRVSLLIRHSSILGNDDEFEQTMSPFIEKVKGMDKRKIPESGEWAFLRGYESPIVEENLEMLSERGRKDAKALGKYIRNQYDSLFPDWNKKKFKGKKGKGKDKATTYKVWTASSTRDIETAKAYVRGSFPKHQAGHEGEGDGDVVQLVRVPNKAKDWDRSLTPHKACDAFEKQSSLAPANQWLSVYAPKVRERLAKVIPEVVEELNDQDVLAMQMLCGYETIATGTSPFCSLFTDSEWLDAEYYFDIRFHYMMGYGNTLSPYLGMPWVKSAAHLLDGKDTDDRHLDEEKVGDDLPKPQLPPNATHTQLLHPSFTHRESPAFVAVFLNLYNSTTVPHPAYLPPALDHRPENRSWRTSHLVSFLGHIALERFRAKETKQDYVRAVVNGKMEVMAGCEDGLEGSCKWGTFKKWVREREERWSGWEGVCEKATVE